MTIGHQISEKPFKPNPNLKGGSEKGKPWNKWPLLLLVVADSIYIRAKGTESAMLEDRKWLISTEKLSERMEIILPGIWEWLAEWMSTDPKTHSKNLYNRIYKMYYNGTSNRGFGHDPWTRAAMSNEHWRCRKGGNSFISLHNKLVKGLILTIPNWKKDLR